MARRASLASAATLTRAAEDLAKQCPLMARLYDELGPPPIRAIRPDFSGLVQIVCGQQVSAASAAAIWRRVATGLGKVDAARIRKSSERDLASLGLSKPKIRTLKALAAAEASGALNIAALNRASDESVFETLTALHGIGPWTAEIYLLFALNRADVFPAGDLALQLAAAHLLEADERFAPAALLDVAERWRPWRAVAARMLWCDYGRRREAATLAAKAIVERTSKKPLKARK